MVCDLFTTLSVSHTKRRRFAGWLMKGLGRELRWPSRGVIPEFALRDRRKPRKLSVKRASGPTEIGTDHLPNTILNNYRYASRLGWSWKYVTCSFWGEFLLFFGTLVRQYTQRNSYKTTLLRYTSQYTCTVYSSCRNFHSVLTLTKILLYLLHSFQEWIRFFGYLITPFRIKCELKMIADIGQVRIWKEAIVA
jgi:hypothetical protein